MRRPAVALLVLAGMTGCGGGPTRADDVERYVKQANRIQSDAAPRFQQIADTYKRYSDGKLSGKTAVVRLTQAESLIAQTRGEVSRLKAPADAARLRALLLRTYDQTVLFAGELRQLAIYVPAAKRQLRTLDVLRRRLRDGLRDGQKPERQATVLKRYATDLNVRIQVLKTIKAPPVLAPTADAQIARLQRTRSLALGLVAALRAADEKRVTRLLARFRDAGDTTSEQQRLATAAFGAYEARRVELRQLASRTRLERARLIATLR